MADPTSTSYPQSKKLSNNADARDSIIEFVEWLNDAKRISLGGFRRFDGFRDEMFTPVSVSLDSLLMEFLGIDPVALEKERRAMLEALRG